MIKKSSNSDHLLYLDGLRAISAMYVVAHHAILCFYNFKTENLVGIQKELINIFFLGHFSVNVFIVLSGFCLMLPVIKSDYKLKGGMWFFYTKRAIRIIPTYYIAIGFSLLVINFFIGRKTGTIWDVSIPVTKQGILAEILFIHDCFNSTLTKINYAFWSIAVETRIYIIFPVIVFLYRKFSAIWIISLSVIISLLIFYFLKVINSIDNIIPLERSGLSPYLILFVLGMVAADICFAKEFKFGLLKKLPWNTILLIMTIAVPLSNKLLHKDILTWQEVDIVVGTWAACLLITCNKEIFSSNKPLWITKFLSWRPFVFTGTFAYSLYLTHAPLLQIITQYIILPMHLDKFTSAMLILILGLPICIGFAYLFFILFEKPFLNIGKKVTFKTAEIITSVNPAI